MELLQRSLMSFLTRLGFGLAKISNDPPATGNALKATLICSFGRMLESKVAVRQTWKCLMRHF